MQLVFKPITWADLGPLYAWRRDQATREASFKDPPTWDQHVDWMNQELAVWPPQTFIGVTHKEVPAVMVAIIDGEVNLMVNPELRRQGYAKQALSWAQGYCPRLVARVKVGNVAGLKLFASCDFIPVEAEDERPCLVLTWNREEEQ